MDLQVYTYDKCDTCRKALKWLAACGIRHEVVPIRERPPTLGELHAMLGHVGDLRRLFNVSGRDYRAMNLKARLPDLAGNEALALLARNGNLVRRPFAITARAGTVGFTADEWQRLFGGG